MCHYDWLKNFNKTFNYLCAYMHTGNGLCGSQNNFPSCIPTTWVLRSAAMLPSRPLTHSLNNPAGLDLVFCLRQHVKLLFEALVSILVLRRKLLKQE